jgi:hypothetical protein
MMLIAGNRETAKTGAQKSANREGTGEPTDGGQDKRPRGAARLGDGRGIVSASVFILRRDVSRNCAARARDNSAIPSTKITPRGTSGHDQRG